MTFFEAFFLSLLQGATEFLPVSSSGHLALAHALLGGEFHPETNLPFDVLVHFGTLLAILAVFWRQVAELIGFACNGAWRLGDQGGVRQAFLVEPRGRLVLAICLATAPTAVIGFFGRSFFADMFQEPAIVGAALCCTGTLLVVTLVRTRRNVEVSEVTDSIPTFPLWMALFIGVTQGMAIMPGISRSGTTIAVALLLGMNRRMAGEFSFLIALPAVLGAVILQLPDITNPTGGLSLGISCLAVAVSAISGWFFLRILLRFVRKGQFGWFSGYCFAVGIWAISRFS